MNNEIFLSSLLHFTIRDIGNNDKSKIVEQNGSWLYSNGNFYDFN